jgi:hypothetical protein
VSGVGATPRRSVVAKDIRDLQRWTGHGRGLLGRQRRRNGVIASLLMGNSCLDVPLGVPSVHRRKRRRGRPMTSSRRRRLIRADAQINSSRRRLIRVERPPPADFAKMVELFEALVSVTQQFNTASMGRLTLNVLLSFGGAWACGQSRRGPRSSRL